MKLNQKMPRSVKAECLTQRGSKPCCSLGGSLEILHLSPRIDVSLPIITPTRREEHEIRSSAKFTSAFSLSVLSVIANHLVHPWETLWSVSFNVYSCSDIFLYYSWKYHSKFQAQKQNITKKKNSPRYIRRISSWKKF